jgi:hypothetical protein
LLEGERQKFLGEQWPRIAATIQRLGITPKELLAAAKRRSASGSENPTARREVRGQKGSDETNYQP